METGITIESHPCYGNVEMGKGNVKIVTGCQYPTCVALQAELKKQGIDAQVAGEEGCLFRKALIFGQDSIQVGDTCTAEPYAIYPTQNP